MSEVTEFLEHYGKKGMKWGKTTTTKSSSADIKSARNRHNTRVDEIENLALKAMGSQTVKGRTAAVKSMNALAKEGLNSGDAKIAAKITRGEKVAVALLASPLALVTIPSAVKARQAVGENYLDNASRVSVKDFG